MKISIKTSGQPSAFHNLDKELIIARIIEQ